MALARAAGSLCPPFEVASREPLQGVRLRDPSSALPEIVLRLEKEHRLFSRTLFLVVEAEVASRGPSQQGVAELHRGRFGRRSSLRWEPAGQGEEQAWCLRFAEAGVIRGAEAMTNIQRLVLRWVPAEGTWRLRVETLAGALIGTSPGASVAVPMHANGKRRALREQIPIFRRRSTHVGPSRISWPRLCRNPCSLLAPDPA